MSKSDKQRPLVGRRISTLSGPARIVAVRRSPSQAARVAHASKGGWRWTVWRGLPVVIDLSAAKDQSHLPA